MAMLWLFILVFVVFVALAIGCACYRYYYSDVQRVKRGLKEAPRMTIAEAGTGREGTFERLGV